MNLRILGGLILLPLFAACDRSAGTNDETTTSLARIWQPDGQPAVGASALVYPAGDTTRTPVGTAVVASDGSLPLPEVPQGWYNVVVTDRNGRAVLLDSLLSTGGAPQASSDTLRRTATLTGRIQVQPHHDPRIAWIQILGVGLYANLDTAGRFRIEGVPAGTLTLAALTREAGYSPTFRSIRAFPDSALDLGTISLTFTGLPSIEGLAASYDWRTGRVSASWHASRGFGGAGYRLYDGDSLLRTTTDTFATLTLFSPADSSPEGNDWFDTAARELDLQALFESRSGALGPAWKHAKLRAAPGFARERGRWTWQKLSSLGWSARPPRIDTVAGLLMAWDPGSASTISVSEDGRGWTTLPSSAAAIGAPLAWKGAIWFVDSLEAGPDPAEGSRRVVARFALGRLDPRTGSLTRDTIVPTRPARGIHLSRSGDSLVVSPYADGLSATDPCGTNGPQVFESWIKRPDGRLAKASRRAFSGPSTQYARGTLRQRTEGMDWWYEASSDSCGLEYGPWGQGPYSPDGLHGSGILVRAVRPAGDTVLLRGPRAPSVMRYRGLWSGQAPKAYKDGIVALGEGPGRYPGRGLFRWNWSDPTRPWTSSLPFSPMTTDLSQDFATDFQHLAPWKDGIAVVSEANELWYGVLTGEE